MNELPHKNRRRWLSFSLRGMLVLISLACILLGWLGRDIYHYRQRMALIGRIEQAGCHYSFAQIDFDGYGGYDLETEPRPLRERILGWCYGPEFHLRTIESVSLQDGNHDALLKEIAQLHTVSSLSLTNVEITAETARTIQEMKSLGEVRFHSTSITPDALARLGSLDTLQELQLYSQAANDENLALAKQFPGLIYLKMGNGTVTDQGLRALKDCPCLRTLHLGGFANVTDEGLKELGGVVLLESLTLVQLPLTDTTWEGIGQLMALQKLRFVGSRDMIQNTSEGLEQLRKLRQLRNLHLPFVSLDDHSCEILGGLTNLQQITCDGTAITDVGIDQLNALSGLESLNIPGATITMDGLNRLSKMPSLSHLQLGGTLDMQFSKSGRWRPFGIDNFGTGNAGYGDADSLVAPQVDFDSFVPEVRID